jgi:PAS domain S-box-containing protein
MPRAWRRRIGLSNGGPGSTLTNVNTPGPGVTQATPTAILEAVAFAAQAILESDSWESAMPQVLARLGTAANASRAHVFRNHTSDEGRLLTSQAFEWCAPGIESYFDAEHLQDMDWDASGYSRWAELLSKGKPVYGVASELPVEEREELEAEGVVSTVSFPLFVGGDWWGTVGLDDCVNERAWGGGELEALRSAAALIGSGILRRRVEAEYRQLVENGPLMTYQETHPGSRSGVELHYLSPQVEDVLGYPAELWLDPGFWPSIVHPDDQATILGEDEKGVAKGVPFDEEYRVIASDGRVVWLADRAIPVRDEDGNIAYWQGFMLDITARKAAEQQLAAAEERYRFIVEQGPLATYLLAFPQYPDLHPIYLSPQFETMLGYPLATWEDSGFWDSIVHPEDLDLLHSEDERSLKEGDFDLEYRMLAADGRTVWVHDTAEVIITDDGSSIWKGFLADVTQRRLAVDAREEALEQERRAKVRVEELSDLKDVLLQAVAHDIRTPLTAILGMATTLAQPDVSLSEAETKEFGQRIAVNTTRLDRLVSDLLDLDRLSRGELHTNLLTVDLATIAREVAEFVDARGRELIIDTSPTVVQADPAKIERIIDNLVGNAAKHTPVSAHIWVRTEPTEGGGLIAVEDDGDGVPDSDRERIFDIYRRGSEAPGSGVGLSLVKRFAEVHGGRAWVAERPGGGASFRVWLPTAPAP